MPLPKPNSGETRENFMNRCMSNPTMNSEYSDNEQRYAVCNTQWRDRNKKSKDMIQFKDFSSIIEDVDDKGIVTKYVNAFGNVDSDKDRSLQGSFKKTINDNFKRVKWFLNHDYNQLLGVPLEANEDSFGLKIRSQLNMKKEISRDVYEDYKLYAANDRTLEHSIGVTAVKFDKDEKTGIRDVTEWKLFEYSTLYFLGANELTPMVNIKNLNDIKNTIELLEKMLKGKYSEEKLEQIEITLNELKSLINEPSDDTQNEPVDVNVMLEKYDLFKI